MKMVFYCCDLVAQNTSAQSTHEKNIRHITMEEHSIKYMTSTPQNYQGYKTQTNQQTRNKDSLRNYHIQEEPQERHDN